MTDDICAQLDRDGYILVENVLKAGDLHRVQEAFRTVEEQTREDWSRKVSGELGFKPYGLGPDAHVVFPIIDHDDLFVDLLEHPLTTGITQRIQGPDIMMVDNALHVKPAGTPSHTKWHRDNKMWKYDNSGWDEPTRGRWQDIRACDVPHFKIKVFFMVDDIGHDTAPFSVVPGSHRWERDPDKEGPLDAMPDHVRLTGSAGSAIIWNGSIWHTAMDNGDTRAFTFLPSGPRHRAHEPVACADLTTECP
jgi:ectoine hydroxylase-related dioxygenase (phytanoyl-CoA dioxygenase family)